MELADFRRSQFRQQRANGVGGQNVQTYAYTALRTHLNDIGNLGYLTMKVTDQSTGIVTESNYSQDYANFTEGLLTSSKTMAPGGTLLSVQTTSWAVASGPTADGTPRRFRYSPTSTTVKRDLNNALMGTTTESADYSDGAGNMFNNYGFPRQVVSSTQSPNGVTTYTKTTTNTYTHNATSWILGRLTAAQVTHQETGKANIVRNSAFTYNATTGFLLTETVEPGSALSYTKTNTYDGFGAITALTETWGTQNNFTILNPAGATAASRVTSYAYDSRRRQKVTETNPLGHTQNNVYNPVNGVVTSTTGPNGLTTSWPSLDAFGRPLRENRADGTYTTTERAFCGGAVSCPSTAATRIVTKVYGSGNQIAAPTQTVYQDELYRDVRGSAVSLSGTEVNVDTVYDSRGRITSKTEPYFAGAATVYSTQIQYDLINRPLLTTRPDSSTQSVVYNGLTETSTNELGQTKSVTKDAMGREASITDNLGTTLVYAYDSIGQITSMQVQGAAGTTSTYAYDVRGNKIADSDPDKGSWTYSYNALGQIASQTDAKGQATTMTYDLLGRMLKRIDNATAANPALRTATWVYDTAPMGAGGPAAKGKLASVSQPNYAAVYAYDALLRDQGVTETIEGSNYASSTAYDTASRPLTVTYPSGLAIRNAYNANGYLTGVSNAATSAAYWTAGTADARGNVTSFTLGNGVQTTKAYDAQRGWLKSMVSQKGTGPLLQNLTYTFNQIGNLTLRANGQFTANPLTETITYDALNRLASSATVQAGTGGFSATVNVVYDVLGNITSKSDVGAYTYGGGACGGGKHAVTSVSGTKAASYCYDANGNMVSGDNRTIAYSAFDMPTQITKGNITTSFFYGPDRARYKRTDLMPEGLTTTIYAGGGAFEQITRADGSLEKKSYIGGFAIVTERTSMGSTTTSTAYVLADHLGSIDTLSNEAGSLLQKMSFDAWGKRRQQSWASLASPLYFDTSITTRGFTGHEEIDTVGLVHMNGRVYDPELGRFIQADPFVQDGSNAQSWNRYSYVLNNPLSMTDPTGYFFGSIFKAIGNFFNSVFKAVVSLLKAVLKIPLLRSVIQIVACFNPISCVAAAGIMTAVMGGSISDIVMAMAMSAAQIGVWSAVSVVTTAIQGAMNVAEGVLNGAAMAFGIVKGALHGVVGGAISLAQGGRFIDGFVANAVGAFAGVMSTGAFGPAGTGGAQGFFGRVSTAAIAGGTAAELTGGKFANGALTAAFAQAYNAEQIAQQFFFSPRVSPNLFSRPPTVIRPPPGVRWDFDPTLRPGPGWVWRGPGAPGSPRGNWFHPETGASLRGDRLHPEGIAPHNDFKPFRNSPTFRWFQDGTMQPKAIMGPVQNRNVFDCESRECA